MKCFCHSGYDAIAICKACGRGLCSGCVAEVGLSCSCRNRCEDDVGTLNDLVQRTKTSYQKTSATYYRIGAFTLLIGIIIMTVRFTIAMGDKATEWGAILVLLGILFTGLGSSHFTSGKRIGQK